MEALDDPARGGLPEAVRLGLHRILEEALNNVARHAQARTLRVRLALRPPRAGTPGGPPGDRGAAPDHSAWIELVLEDNGKGFDPSSFIAVRAEDLGGDWAITSAPGTGTTLRVGVPLGGAAGGPAELPAGEPPAGGLPGGDRSTGEPPTGEGTGGP